MRQPVTSHEADRQLPQGEEIFLDHVGHFVRDPKAASDALVRAGFAPAPISVQVNPDGTPTGTGNVTAMFSRGYIEVLFKTADTPLGLEFEAALEGGPGVHLVAFSVGDAAGAHERLTGAGFAMRPLVQFQRPVDTESGPGIAAFTVVRVERGAMAEGRVQILAHRTEDTVWQKRWLKHRNGALGLVDLVVVSADVLEAAGRFEQFTGCEAKPTKFGTAVVLDRGQVQLMTPDAFAAMVPEVAVPKLPFMAAYAIRVQSLAVVEALVKSSGMSSRRIGAALLVLFPPELGAGAWLFVENPADLPWRSR